MARLQFDRFAEFLPPDPNSVSAPPGMIEELKSSVPDDLPAFWQGYGLGSFGDGALVFIDPRDVAEDVAVLSGRRNMVPFARTAFGDLFSVDDDTVYLTNVEYLRTIEVNQGLDLFGFSTLSSKSLADDLLMRPFKRQAEAKLGRPGFGECYGYRLALSAGGAESIENLEIKNFEVYIAVLADLATMTPS